MEDFLQIVERCGRDLLRTEEAALTLARTPHGLRREQTVKSHPEALLQAPLIHTNDDAKKLERQQKMNCLQHVYDPLRSATVEVIDE